jgi:hypothetical protein
MAHLFAYKQHNRTEKTQKPITFSRPPFFAAPFVVPLVTPFFVAPLVTPFAAHLSTGCVSTVSTMQCTMLHLYILL